jgi:flavin-dependent dehydrogenase
MTIQFVRLHYYNGMARLIARTPNVMSEAKKKGMRGRLVERSEPLKIAIAGAGTTGAYAYRLLRHRGMQADIYGRDCRTACGINPCAWGTSRDFFDLVDAAGLDPEKYLLQATDHLWMDDVRIPGELMTFDKPALIQDLLQGATVKKDPLDVTAYDRVIDATGIARSYLPPIDGDVLLPCVQRRIETSEPLENRIKLGGVGYAWIFPLSRYGYHIGCGSLAGDPKAYLASLGWVENRGRNPSKKVLCACSGRVRLTGPYSSQPFVVGDSPRGVWGVGESIGCVAPLAGDGVVPGMRSVQILLQHWNDPEAYTKSILNEFRWMEKERQVIDKLLTKGGLGIKDAWVLKKNSRRMGMRVGVKGALSLLRALAKK